MPATPRTLDLNTLHLAKGGHGTPDQGLCLLEAVAMFAGKDHTDRPPCVSEVLGDFGRRLNDVLPDDLRQELKPFIPQLPGTAGDGLDEQRGYLALDWLIRTYTPAWLDLAGLTVEASELRALRRIVDLSAARAAGPVVRSSRDRAAAAWAAARAAAGAAAWDAAWDAAWAAARDAAGDAARAAAWDAAWDAAGDAAGDAARAAAWDAAWAAARDAAGAAAWDAAGDALKPTVTTLQRSAIGLFGQMIRPEPA